MVYLDLTRPITPGIASNEGGQVFQVDDFTRLRRFLILGSEGGTFYTSARDLSIENADVVRRCLDADFIKTIQMIVEVSEQGVAPKNEPAIYALALAASHTGIITRKTALDALPKVCRTGTHLLHFMKYCKAMRKSSRMYRTAIGKWFNDKPADKIAYQAVKYKQRDGWSLADALRIARPTAPTEQHNAVYKYIVDGQVNQFTPNIISAVSLIQTQGAIMDIPSMIRKDRIPREAVPTEMLNDPKIWEALLDDMPMTAMIRNLGKMTSVGLITPGSNAAQKVILDLMNTDRLQRSRVHPIQLLAALKVYEQGRGIKGSLQWKPDKVILGALDAAFYEAFKNITPSGKRICLALDVSSSMDGNRVNGMDFMDARMASCAMALVTAATEPNTTIVAYAKTLVPFEIRPSMRLDDVIRQAKAIPFGGTDCRLPIINALERGVAYDGFVSYTDSETTASNGGFYGHANSSFYRDVLALYRGSVVKGARSVVVGVTATHISLNDPADVLGLDVVGFDSSAPAVISDFIAGKV